jgi:hypothetical protein
MRRLSLAFTPGSIRDNTGGINDSMFEMAVCFAAACAAHGGFRCVGG